MSNSIILSGDENTIENSSLCTIINGANNTISGKTNSHIVGNNITASSSNTFFVGCNLNVIGAIYAEGDVVAFSSSDKRLKNNIVKIDKCLDKVLSLDAIEFDWNEKQGIYEGHDIGLIAQQVQEIAPEIVTKRQNGYLAIKYEKVIPLLVGAIQEQDSKIEGLEKQVQELLNKPNC